MEVVFKETLWPHLFILLAGSGIHYMLTLAASCDRFIYELVDCMVLLLVFLLFVWGWMILWYWWCINFHSCFLFFIFSRYHLFCHRLTKMLILLVICVKNHGIIRREVIDVSKIANIRVLMWEILKETHCRVNRFD